MPLGQLLFSQGGEQWDPGRLWEDTENPFNNQFNMPISGDPMASGGMPTNILPSSGMPVPPGPQQMQPQQPQPPQQQRPAWQQGLRDYLNEPGTAMAYAALSNLNAGQPGSRQQRTDPIAAYQQAVQQRSILKMRERMNEETMKLRAAQEKRLTGADERAAQLHPLAVQAAENKLDPGSGYRTLVDSGLIDPEQMSFTEYSTMAANNGLPANIQEWNVYSALTEDQQKAYLEMKRAAQIVQLGGGLPGQVSGGQVVPVTGPGQTPEEARTDFAGAEADVAGQKTAASAAAQTQEDINAKAPGEIASGQTLLGLIDLARKHPGREAATGASSITNPLALPGTDQKDFLVLSSQLRGNAFLNAYQSLKGGGPITDIEGKAATEAQARLNEAQSEEAYLTALSDMEKLIEKRMKRARETASPGTNLPAEQTPKTYNPATGEIE